MATVAKQDHIPQLIQNETVGDIGRVTNVLWRRTQPVQSFTLWPFGECGVRIHSTDHLFSFHFWLYEHIDLCQMVQVLKQRIW